MPFKCDIPTEGDVVEAYASAMYDNRVPQCLFQPAWETRFEHLKELIKEYRVDGVLWTARSETGANISENAVVTVTRIEGAKLFVRPVEVPVETL